MTSSEAPVRKVSEEDVSQPAVLVIDDDRAMRSLLEIYLAASGYRVLLAQDGEEALELAAAHSDIRVIILDVVMSGLSGHDLAEELTASLPRAQILYCSGHPVSLMARYRINVPPAHFMQKPLRPVELRQKIESMLRA